MTVEIMWNRFLLYLLLPCMSFSGCTRLNLVEQLEPADCRVPIVDTDNQKRAYTLYELDGCYYVPLTVYMGKEEVPLFNKHMLKDRDISYTPDLTTGQVWLFPLSDEEVTQCLENIKGQKPLAASKQAQKTQAATIVQAKDFDFQRARVFRVKDKFSWYAPQSACPSQIGYQYYSPQSLPSDKGSRSWGYYVAYGPVWCADALGNVAIGAVEGVAMAPFAVCIGGMYILLKATSVHGRGL